MVFTQAIFYPFFFITYALFAAARSSQRWQITTLTIASYIFYAWWSVKFACFLLLTTTVDYTLGRLIEAASNRRIAKAWVTLSVVMNLGLLSYFKYCNFFAENLFSALNHLGMAVKWNALDIVLPVGISFYVFQSMSYTIDIYRREIRAVRHFGDFLFFVSAFPQLVAGPIVRAKVFLPQLGRRLADYADARGILLILYGLAKKMFLADPMGVFVVDPTFLNPSQFSPLELLVAAYCYAFQIFFDFSAYSDIAIGLALLIGLRFPPNFLSPYLATHPSEFWKRWHISLSSWLRDYLYVPLGGNRGSLEKTLRNLFLVMLLGGLWHGANWTFLIWGALHGLALVVFRLVPIQKWQERYLPNWVQRFLFFQFICLAWVFFRSPSLDTALDFLKALFSNPTPLNLQNVYISVAFLGAGFLLHDYVEPSISSLSAWFARRHWAFASATLVLILLGGIILEEKGVAQRAFIYFQF